MSEATEWLALYWQERERRIEYRWVGQADPDAPVLVFLHEGLGSVALWKDFPDQICAALRLRGLVYSRPGYGRSTPRPSNEKWAPNFMHQQARELLPVLLSKLGIQRPWLFGHSDGGSIALLYASMFPDAVRGAVVLAPHIFVESISLTQIAAAKLAFERQGLRARLARFHDDVDSAFYGWNDVWLSPAFRDWNIEAELAAIRCPLLAIQGKQDKYGTLQQVTGIRDHLPATEVCVLTECGHSPHRDQPQQVIDTVGSFIARHR